MRKRSNYRRSFAESGKSCRMSISFFRAAAKVLAKLAAAPATGSASDRHQVVVRELWREFAKSGSSAALVAELEAAALIDDVRASQLAEKYVGQFGVEIPVADREELVRFLSKVPASIRERFRRSGEPSGKKAPKDFALNSAADLGALLPRSLPSCLAGRTKIQPASTPNPPQTRSHGWIWITSAVLVAAIAGAATALWLKARPQNPTMESPVVEAPKENARDIPTSVPKEEAPLDPTNAKPPETAKPVAEPNPKTQPTVSPAESERREVVKSIVAEWKLLPPTRGAKHAALQLNPAIPPSSLAALKAYRAPSEPLDVVRKKSEAKPAAFPLRKAYFDAVKALEASTSLTMPEEYGPKDKARFAKLQKDVGLAIFGLEQAVDAMEAPAAQKDSETSKRWQAHFDYAQARMHARLAYLYEYNALLAQTRGDSLPDAEKNKTGWKLQAVAKLSCPERRARDSAKAALQMLRKIEESYPDTPWSWYASREREEPLGLVWRSKEK
jgi:hypothetical protein